MTTYGEKVQIKEMLEMASSASRTRVSLQDFAMVLKQIHAI